MTAKTNYLEDGLIGHLFGGAALPQPTQWWLALYSEDPTNNVSDSSPVPVMGKLQIVNWTTTVNGNEVQNTDLIQFPPVPVGQAYTVSHFALFDAQSAGHAIYHGAFRTPKALQEGDILFIAAGQLLIRET